MGIVGSLFSGIFGSNAASKTATVEANASTHAADLEKQAADASLAFNKQQYGNSLALLSPFYNSGVSATNRLDYLMGLSPNRGIPPGVVNPNASTPSSTNGRFPGGLNLNGLNGDVTPALGPGGAISANSFSSFAPRSGMAFDGNGVINGGINPGTTANATPGQVPFQNPDIGAFPGLNGAPGTATASTGNTVSADGSPGIVPRTDGGGASDPNAPGGFGSLAQGWGKTFASPTDLTQDPGYNFRLQQGLQSLNNSAAARGGLLTGGTAKAINDYAGGSASQEYQNTYNRALQNYNTNYNTFTNDQTNTFNRLQALMNGGQVSGQNLSASGLTAANNAANINLSSAANIGGDLQNAANATGSGYINKANAITGAMNSGTNSLASLLALFGG